MKNCIVRLMTVGLLMLPASVMAQQVTTYSYGGVTPYYSSATPYYGTTTSYYGSATPYYSSARPYYNAAPVLSARPVTVVGGSDYSAAPVSVYSPYSSGPIRYARPTYQYYSPYGGSEARVPGQPILNTLRTIIP